MYKNQLIWRTNR